MQGTAALIAVMGLLTESALGFSGAFTGARISSRVVASRTGVAGLKAVAAAPAETSSLTRVSGG